MTSTREQFRAFLDYNIALDNELDCILASSSLVTPRDMEAAKGLITHMERGTVHVLESPASIFKLAEAMGVETRWTAEQEAVIDKTDRAMAEYRRRKADRVVPISGPSAGDLQAKHEAESGYKSSQWLGVVFIVVFVVGMCALAVMIRRHG